MPIKRICERCKNIFWAKPVHVREGGAKFCSYKCYWTNLKGSKRPLWVCKKIAKSITGKGNPFYGKRHTEETKEKNRIAHTGSNSPCWKGGRRITAMGYVLIYKSDHPFTNTTGCVFEHRLVAESILGRYLTKKEVIHHIDENTQNNTPSNLYLFAYTQLHIGYHRRVKKHPETRITKSNLI